MTVQKRYYHLIGLFFDLGAPTVFLAISNFITIFKAHWRCIETHITVGCSRRLPVLGRVSTRAKLPHLNSFVFPQPAQGNVERSSFEFETPCSEKCTRVSVYYLGFDDFGGKLCSQSTAYQFLTLLVKCWFWVRSMWPPPGSFIESFTFKYISWMFRVGGTVARRYRKKGYRKYYIKLT